MMSRGTIWLSLMVILALGCSAPTQRERDLRLTRQAVQAAFEAPDVEIRYNPVECQCPPFEAKIGPRWIRVEILVGPVPEVPLAAFLEEMDKELRRGFTGSYQYPMELETRTERYCPNGTIYFEASVLPQREP